MQFDGFLRVAQPRRCKLLQQLRNPPLRVAPERRFQRGELFEGGHLLSVAWKGGGKIRNSCKKPVTRYRIVGTREAHAPDRDRNDHGSEVRASGGSLSIAEIVVTLYFDVLRHDPANPKWKDRDPSSCPRVTVAQSSTPRWRSVGIARRDVERSQAGVVVSRASRCSLFPGAGSIDRIVGSGLVARAGHGFGGEDGQQPRAELRSAGRW